MNRRHKSSKGQALVLVTFALLAMCGIMGLVVDLGWSFYLKKAAQAAADAGALAAVQEAKVRMKGNFSGFTCAAGAALSTPVDCAGSQALCSSYGAGSTSNLNAACLYAKTNGFTDSGNQHVSVQANDSSSMPTTLTGTYSSTTLAYWTTVRVSQTVPQLFSAVLGNPTGTISASATAAVIATVVPGQFIALNQAGNCMTGSKCGVDFDLGGGGTVVAPGGVIISSTCNGANNTAGSNTTGCGSNSPLGNSTNGSYATLTGNGSNGSQCVSTGTNCTSDGSLVQIQGPGAVDNLAHFSPAPVQVGAATAQDPLLGDAQPPLVTPSSPVATCGIPAGSLGAAGTINGGNSNSPLVLGPFQYYTYYQQGNNPPVLTGAPISVTGNVTFSSSSTTCSNGGSGGFKVNGAAQGSFPGYLFYGGLIADGSQANINFGAGQYVSVGATSGGNALTLATNGGPTITGDNGSGGGTMFITTAPGYSSALTSQMSGLTITGTSLTAGLNQVSLLQGGISIGGGNSASITLTGLDQQNVSSSLGLGQYNGIAIWQDRRNSTSYYTTDASGNNIIQNTNGNYAATNAQMTANLVTPVPNPMSPQFTFTSAPNLNITGTIYQPQGAWINMLGGGKVKGGSSPSFSMQIITGGIIMQGGPNVILTPVTNSSIRYITALIQ